ncbi:MCP four helix bundle domain-containing protein [Ralstonia solanacearum]|nr:MCP four helix bundle domain-containing protein [Ralstonia solanacearum]
MSIKTRLTLGFGALAVCVVVVSALSLRALSESTQGFSGFVQAITARATLANNMRTAVDRRAIAARNLVLVIKPQDLEMEKAEVLRAHEEVQAQLAQLKAMADDGRNVSEQARDRPRGSPLRPRGHRDRATGAGRQARRGHPEDGRRMPSAAGRADPGHHRLRPLYARTPGAARRG